jgi:hypothetical protein
LAAFVAAKASLLSPLAALHLPLESIDIVRGLTDGTRLGFRGIIVEIPQQSVTAASLDFVALALEEPQP